jgi:Dyp-type peroxidase family
MIAVVDEFGTVVLEETAAEVAKHVNDMEKPSSDEPAQLDLNAIQGTVLRGYRMAYGSYLFVRIDNAEAGRGWLEKLIPEITTAAHWVIKPQHTLNIAFSAAGMRALGVGEDVLGGFSQPFLDGMATRAAALGDTGDSAPKNWQDDLGTDRIHAVLSVLAQTPEALAAYEKKLRSAMGKSVREISRIEVQRLPDGAEHFGFTDGFSQPDIEGVENGPRSGLGAFAGHGKWRPIRAGEFVLGYPDEESVLPDAPPLESLARNGSYLAIRKLRQDVVGFREMLATAAKRYGGSEEMLAAKLVGRWPDGAPLDLAPDAPDPALAADPNRNNGFDYSDDSAGYRCPVGAHIRRANPRLSLPFDGKLVNRHRLVRRGLPYGPPLPDGAADDGVERGIVFACYQADLERQFEFIQSQWLNDGNPFNLGADKDPLLGDNDGTGKHTIQGAPPSFVGAVPRLVTTVGGEYFFAPGINGLRYLARPISTHPE